LYVADNYNDRIQKFNLNGGFITKWGNYGSNNGQFKGPEGIALDSSENVYVADSINHRIQKFDQNGLFIMSLGMKGNGNSQFNYPSDIAIDQSGNIYITDGDNCRIQKLGSGGNFLLSWGSEGGGGGQFRGPMGICVDSSGNVYVADTFNHRIQKFDQNGTFLKKWGVEGNGNGEFNRPFGIEADNSGNVYVCDVLNNRVQKFDSDGNFIVSINGLRNPWGIAVDSSGNVYISDSGNQKVRVFKSAVKILPGDMNKDGSVKADDAIIALQIAADVREPTDYEKVAGDITGDGKILANDVIKILQIVAGLGAPYMSFPAVKKPITLALSELHGVDGDTVILPLKLDSTYNLAGGDICVAYDSAVLQAIEVSSPSNALMVSKLTDSGVIRIAFAGSGNLDRNTLANVKFRMLSDGVSPLKFRSVEFYGFDGNPISTIYSDKEFRSWAVAPERSELLQNYPNPFNPETWIPFQLKEGGNVKINIYSLSGELVRELNLGYKLAGVYINSGRAAYWDGKDKFGQSVANGIYFYSISAGNFTAVKKLAILK
jgi:hypothetical protein